MWEDTVMSDDRIYTACVYGFGKKVEADNLTDEIKLKRHEGAKQVAREQAQITWDKAINDVVEWIRQENLFIHPDKLKEWGVKDDKV